MKEWDALTEKKAAEGGRKEGEITKGHEETFRYDG